MSDAKSLYDDMINAGISDADARQFILDQLGEDPVRLECAVVTVMVEVEVNLDYNDLEGIDCDDDMAIIDIACDKAASELGDTYGDMNVTGTCGGDLVRKSLDNGELVC